jgi:hypothetical protein
LFRKTPFLFSQYENYYDDLHYLILNRCAIQFLVEVVVLVVVSLPLLIVVVVVLVVALEVVVVKLALFSDLINVH